MTDDDDDDDDVGDAIVCSEVVSSDEFLNLPVDQVTKLIADDQLAVSSEEQVFNFIVNTLWQNRNVYRVGQKTGQFILCSIHGCVIICQRFVILISY